MLKKPSFKALILKTNERSRNQRTITINIILPLYVKNVYHNYDHTVVLFCLMRIVPNDNLISPENFFSGFLNAILLNILCVANKTETWHLSQPFSSCMFLWPGEFRGSCGLRGCRGCTKNPPNTKSTKFNLTLGGNEFCGFQGKMFS